MQDETRSLYHIYSCLRYRAQNWVLTILLYFNKISFPWWAERLAFPQAGLMLLPVVLSLRVTLILSKQLKQAILFFPLLFAKTTHWFSSLIWAWQPAALGRVVLEGKQHVCLQPGEPGISTCHGALINPFTHLSGSSGLLRQVLPRALTHPRRINSLEWGCVWAETIGCVPTVSQPPQPLTPAIP